MKYYSLKSSYNKLLLIMGIIITINILSSCENRKNTNNNEEDITDSLLKQGKDSMLCNADFAKNILKKVMFRAKDSMQYYDAFEAYGNTFLTSSQFDSGMQVKHRVIDFLNKQPESEKKERLLSTTCKEIGNIYSLTGQTDSALRLYKRAFECRIAKKDKIKLAINIAYQYKQKGDYANATYYLRNALLTTDSIGMPDMQFPIHFALGDIYLNLKDYSNSNHHYLYAEKEYEQKSIMERIVFSNNRGNYYYYTGNYSMAKEWYEKEKELAENARNDYFSNLSYLNLADTYLNIGKTDSSVFYVGLAEPYFNSIHFQTALYYINTIKIGLAIKKHNYKQANLLKTQVNNEKNVDPNIISIRNNYLEKLALQQRNYEEAYRYLRANVKLNDSLRNDITQKRVEELDIRYKQDTTLMRKVIMIQKRDATVKNLTITTYVWIFISTLFLIISISIYFYIKKRHSIQRMKYLEQLASLRMTNIRNRISPHFMFNVLNNEMTGEGAQEKNIHLYTLAHLLRKSLQMTEKTSIKLTDEIAFAKDYIALDGIRIGDNFSTEWIIDPDIDTDKIEVFPMMLQIPIENALKHGLRGIEGEKKLTVSINALENGIGITVIDNGRGYHPEKTTGGTSGTGTGLKVLKQTMLILNSRNSEKITFSIKNIEGNGQTGTQTEIYIPYGFKFE